MKYASLMVTVFRHNREDNPYEDNPELLGETLTVAGIYGGWEVVSVQLTADNSEYFILLKTHLDRADLKWDEYESAAMQIITHRRRQVLEDTDG